MYQTTISNQYEIKLHEHIIKFCHSLNLKLHDNKFGNKQYTNYQRIALIILHMRTNKSLRRFTEELVESKWPNWLGLKQLVTKSTLQRWIKKWTLSYLRQLLYQTVFSIKPKLMAIDATGFDSWKRSRHYEKRLKQFGVNKPKDNYAKVDLLVDIKHRLIFDFVLRTKPRHDTLGAKTMIKRFKRKNTLILADKGYDSEKLHNLVVKSGNELYFQRNIIESINFSLKSRFRSLNSKLHYMKKREFAWKIITYNLIKLSELSKVLIQIILKLIIWDRTSETKQF